MAFSSIGVVVSNHRLATVPTIGDALAALDDLTSDLAEVLKQISDIGAELATKHHVGSSDVQEVCRLLSPTEVVSPTRTQILRDFDPMLLQALEPEQTRSLIYRELKRIALSLRNDAKGALGTPPCLAFAPCSHESWQMPPKCSCS
jgi:nuclear pore complex protein Nup205